MLIVSLFFIVNFLIIMLVYSSVIESFGSMILGIRTTHDFDESFLLDKKNILISLKQGEVRREYIQINNAGNSKIRITLIPFKIDNIVEINEEIFELDVNEFKRVALDFIARRDIVSDLYIGKIIVEGNGIVKDVSVIVEVEPSEKLFDVQINIPEKFLKVSAGESFISNIRIFEITDIGVVDMEISYNIIDSSGNSIYSETEIIALSGQENFVKKFKIPENAAGLYTFYVKVGYDEYNIIKKSLFLVERDKFELRGKFFYSLIIFNLIFVALFFYIVKKYLYKKKDIKI